MVSAGGGSTGGVGGSAQLVKYRHRCSKRSKGVREWHKTSTELLKNVGLGEKEEAAYRKSARKCKRKLKREEL